MESIFYRDIEQNIMMIQKALPVGKSFDIIIPKFMLPRKYGTTRSASTEKTVTTQNIAPKAPRLAQSAI